ncbi:hypothetical protein Tco_0652232 [Tanacetum coccineum]|uniref:Uncharacterized protein n=1 Tax=Tanacetum coccineum TaxID=301880 RepID=A0ABQ4WX00_9ASTR
MKIIMSKILAMILILSGFDQFQPPQFLVNYPPQETNKEILQAQEDLMEAIQAFLKEYDHIPPNEKCMALLLAEERFLKIKQVIREEHNQPEVMQELLLKLMMICKFLKEVNKRRRRRQFKFSRIPFRSNTRLDIDCLWGGAIRRRRECGNFSTQTNANNSLPEYDSFLFEVETDHGGLISIVIYDNSNDPLLELPEFESFHFDLYDDPLFPCPPPEPPDVEISLIIETDTPVINNVDELNEDECFDPGGDEIDVEDDDSFTFVIQSFLPFLTYLEISPLLFSTKNEDTIFDPGIST